LTKTFVGLVNCIKDIKVVETIRERPQHLHLWAAGIAAIVYSGFSQAIESKNRSGKNMSVTPVKGA
jgi:hypothetical protein